MIFPKKIGITGGIGAGKSIVSTVLRELGYAVYDSDQRAKQLMNDHPEIRQQLKTLFGDEVYIGDILNRPFLAQRIFSQPNNRLAVNNIVHPIVRSDFTAWCADKTESLLFQESALLFETGGYRLLDATILVIAPEELRIKRVQHRDNMDREHVLKRMATQLHQKEMVQLADYVLTNDDKMLLLPQVLHLLDNLR